MPLRTTQSVPAVVAIVLAAAGMTAPASHAETQGKACLSTPGKATPQGKHWYYRWDRVNRRKCWYLGEAGKTTRPDPGEVAPAAEAPTPAARPRAAAAPPPRAESAIPPQAGATAQPSDETPVQPDPGLARVPPVSAAPVASPDPPQPAGEARGAETVEARWPEKRSANPLPSVPAPPPAAGDAGASTYIVAPAAPAIDSTATASTVLPSVAPASEPASEGGGTPPLSGERASAEPQGAMPLVWPVLTKADLAAETAGPSLFTRDRLLLLIAAVSAIAALIFFAVGKLFARPPAKLVQADRRAPMPGPRAEDSGVPPWLSDARRAPRPPSPHFFAPPARRDHSFGNDDAAHARRQRWQRKTA